MSGTIPLSLTQQFDTFGQPLKGGQLFLIVAGTVSTPQDGFQDPSLTIKMPYPITLDAAGRIPQFFLADGFIKVRLQDVRGVVQLASDGIQVIGPSGGGGGGGGAVDPNALIQMGNIIARYGIGGLTGYVRLNGLTIGSATSGATERVNADCQALFNYLWITDPNLILTPPRGANAAADWTANKQIALPDWRGYAMGALDDMGNAAAGRLTAAYFGTSPIVLGAAGGAQSKALLAANVPSHTHNGGGTTGNDSPDHSHGFTTPTQVGQGTSGGGLAFSSSGAANTGGASTRHTHSFAFTTDGGAGLSGLDFSVISPRKLCTFYMKL